MADKKIITICIIVMFILIPSIQCMAQQCLPTPSDMLGPFYKPGAPVRSVVGQGYVLSGVVKSSGNCGPLKARIEFWLAGPAGNYDDDHRATVFSGNEGEYKFESNYPAPYAGRPSHIHIRVSAEGHETLVTQHYPGKGKTSDVFNLVLVPVKK